MGGEALLPNGCLRKPRRVCIIAAVSVCADDPTLTMSDSVRRAVLGAANAAGDGGLSLEWIPIACTPIRPLGGFRLKPRLRRKSKWNPL